MFPDSVQAVIDDCLPYIKALPEGRYAISLGGSYGKGTYDGESDLDFRLFYDRLIEPPELRKEANDRMRAQFAVWAGRGVKIDGCWTRQIAAMDAQLEQWIAGTGKPDDLVWAIWGYYLPTDIYKQAVIEDPFGVVADWKARLASYPPALKQAVLKRHTQSLEYWRTDYHYAHKVKRGDLVFLAGMASRLVHDMLQILFALNEMYWAGDGNGLLFAECFAVKPADLTAKVTHALYPQSGDIEAQYETLLALSAEILALTKVGR